MTQDQTGESDRTSPLDAVDCYGEIPHEPHDWTFADDYPLMRCGGVRQQDFDRFGGWGAER